MITLRKQLIVLILGIALVSPYAATAHSLGASWEQVVGDYLIDVGYDPAAIEAGRYARFDFELRDGASRDYLTYDHVWVRIVKDRETLLATGIKRQALGPTTLLYTFADEGKYTLEVSFRDGTETAHEYAQTSFTVPVLPERGENDYSLYLAVIAGFALGSGSLYALFFLRQPTRTQ